ncbi:MAG TPA: hypothetical protein VII13_19035 [Vicinamibacteria bacterium]
MRIAAPVLACLLAVACKQEPAQIGKDTANIAADAQTLRAAQTAVNDVLRAQSDCDAARPLIADAREALDEAGRRVRTAGGQATLDALRTQVANVDRVCP